MKASAEAVFRYELRTLRRRIGRAIREESPSTVREQLEIYSRLLEHVLDRFDELGRAGHRPRYTPLPFGDPSGAELGWIANDFIEFFHLAIRADDDPQTFLAVVDGLFSAVSLTVRSGDSASLALFLRDAVLAWVSTREVNWSEPTRSGVRDHLLLDLEGTMRAVVVMANRGVLDKQSVTNLYVQLVVSYSNLMKVSIDQDRLDDVGPVARSLVGLFGMTRVALGPDSFDGLSPVTSAALHGVDGWLLGLIQRTSEEDNAELVKAHKTLLEVAYDPWAALPFAFDHDVALSLFGWMTWEMEARIDRSGAIGAYRWWMLDSIVRSALQRERSLDLGTVRVAAGGKVGDMAFVVDEILRVSAAVTDAPPADSFLSADRITGLAAQLRALKAEISQLAAQELVDRPLDPERLRQFQDHVAAVRASQPSVLAVLDVREVRGEDHDGSAAREGFVVIGSYEFVPKDYFVLSDVDADPAFLADLRARAQIDAESTYALGQISRELAVVERELERLEEEVVRQIARVRDAGGRPSVVVFGSWYVIEQLRGRRRNEGSRPGGIVGEIDGAEIFWSVTGSVDTCLVFDRGRVGTVLWRAPIPNLGDASIVSERGRVIVGVEGIDSGRAQQLIATDPRLIPSGTTEDDAIFSLQQKVLVRVQEILGWESRPDPLGAVIRISRQ
jgi:hypothetical protein